MRTRGAIHLEAGGGCSGEHCARRHSREGQELCLHSSDDRGAVGLSRGLGWMQTWTPDAAIKVLALGSGTAEPCSRIGAWGASRDRTTVLCRDHHGVTLKSRSSSSEVGGLCGAPSNGTVHRGLSAQLGAQVPLMESNMEKQPRVTQSTAPQLCPSPTPPRDAWGRSCPVERALPAAMLPNVEGERGGNSIYNCKLELGCGSPGSSCSGDRW